MDFISVPLGIDWMDLKPNVIRWSKGYYALLKQTITSSDLSDVKSECLEMVLKHFRLPNKLNSVPIAELLKVEKVSFHLFEKCAGDLRAIWREHGDEE